MQESHDVTWRSPAGRAIIGYGLAIFVLCGLSLAPFFLFRFLVALLFFAGLSLVGSLILTWLGVRIARDYGDILSSDD